ncbi:MAG: hypothetical protein SNI49_02650 [Rikenellaceae bacterium]
MKKLVLFCLLLVICCATFAQAKSVDAIIALEKRIEQLQQENTELRKQFDEFKEESRQSYIKLKDDETSRFNGYIEHVAWLVSLVGVLMTIIVAVVGFFVPYMYNRSLIKKINEAKAETQKLITKQEDISFQLEDINLKAEGFEKQFSKIEKIETQITNIKKSIKKTSENPQESLSEVIIKAPEKIRKTLGNLFKF